MSVRDHPGGPGGMGRRRWPVFTTDDVRRRYNRIAPVFPVFEWIFLLPPGIRRRAVERLALRPGERVLDVGCGTGRNLALLERALGPGGQIAGIDVSDGMLARARRRCAHRGWNNVALVEGDAALLDAAGTVVAGPFDAALFSLSYAVIPERRRALRAAWERLVPGGRLVVMDARPPPGLRGRIVRPVMSWVSRTTVLGDPDVRPWDDLAELAGAGGPGGRVETEEILAGTYFISCAEKGSERR